MTLSALEPVVAAARAGSERRCADGARGWRGRAAAVARRRIGGVEAGGAGVMPRERRSGWVGAPAPVLNLPCFGLPCAHREVQAGFKALDFKGMSPSSLAHPVRQHKTAQRAPCAGLPPQPPPRSRHQSRHPAQPPSPHEHCSTSQPCPYTFMSSSPLDLTSSSMRLMKPSVIFCTESSTAFF